MRDIDRLAVKYRSTTHYILMSLIPYTESNLKLAFLPHRFFNDLEKLEYVKAKRPSIENAYYRAVRQGYISLDERKVPSLSKKGRRKVQPFIAEELVGAKLLIIFDIPEMERAKRSHLRILLRELAFQQIQKSVWISNMDHRQYLRDEIRQNKLESFVQIFEARSID